MLDRETIKTLYLIPELDMKKTALYKFAEDKQCPKCFEWILENGYCHKCDQSSNSELLDSHLTYVVIGVFHY